MALLQTPTISTTEFTWSKKDRIFTTEASDLNGHKMGQAYDDACDVGFTLWNPKTGNQVMLVEAHEERNADGDILYWDYIPIKMDERKRLGFSVRIFND